MRKDRKMATKTFLFIVLALADVLTGTLTQNVTLDKTILQLQKDLIDLRNQFLVELMSLKSTNVEKSKDAEQKNTKLSQLEKENSALKTNLQKLNSALDTAKNAYFYLSQPFGGKRYLLSRQATFYYPSFAQSLCGMHGGYLVEVNTQAEYDFVRKFVRENGSKFIIVMAGGTDEGHEGQWVNRHSQTPVAPLWAPNQPDNTNKNQHCQIFYKPFNWQLDDNSCVFNNSNDVGFVCEVPQ